MLDGLARMPRICASKVGCPPRFCTMADGYFTPLASRYSLYVASTSMSPKIGFSSHVCTRSTRFAVVDVADDLVRSAGRRLLRRGPRHDGVGSRADDLRRGDRVVRGGALEKSPRRDPDLQLLRPGGVGRRDVLLERALDGGATGDRRGKRHARRARRRLREVDRPDVVAHVGPGPRAVGVVRLPEIEIRPGPVIRDGVQVVRAHGLRGGGDGGLAVLGGGRQRDSDRQQCQQANGFPGHIVYPFSRTVAERPAPASHGSPGPMPTNKGPDRLILGRPRERSTPRGPSRGADAGVRHQVSGLGRSQRMRALICFVLALSIAAVLGATPVVGAGRTSPEGLVDRYLGAESQPGQRPAARAELGRQEHHRHHQPRHRQHRRQERDAQPEGWVVRFEADAKDKAGKTITYVLDGKIDNLPLPNRTHHRHLEESGRERRPQALAGSRQMTR